MILLCQICAATRGSTRTTAAFRSEMVCNNPPISTMDCSIEEVSSVELLPKGSSKRNAVAHDNRKIVT